jgi:hypothetical protein
LKIEPIQLSPVFGRALAALLLLGAVQETANAAFVTYTDRADFLSAAASVPLRTANEDFSTDPGDPFTIDDGIGNSVTLDLIGGTWSPVSERLEDAVDVLLRSTAVNGTVVGIGFDFEGVLALGRLEINQADSSAASLSSFTGFVGLLSTDGMTISSVDELSNDTWGNAAVDNIVIVTTPVPLPGAAWLFLSALGAVGLAGMRRFRETRANA